ncbi:CAAX amino terminal protease family [Mesobacillus selenatarsenatis SF-1]|uniref:CAAX amino terminal protease family n=1 Tax=Mesobacillus selenatarsenatis (strain DSM 18680 / JCM 14380 / FERM P-15431 / SF-1) TaxID=1321606 RepID=A0A0A8WZJ1_MESS1|nr:CAAX amino terminal protease family [Mesobacillus selenatarsenatis SF-1]
MGEFLIDLKVNKNYIWVYFIAFYTLWCIRELWLNLYLDSIDSVPGAVTSAIIKIIIWVIPVILLVIIMEKRNPFSYLGLLYNVKNGLKWIGWASLVLLFYSILNITLLKNSIDFQLELREWLNVVLLVGITEEIVFRGFLLRKLMDSFRFWIANAITALLFVSIHFPIWFYKGQFEFPYIFSSILTVFVLGIIFGFIYKKSKSLWSVIIIHSLYNLLVSLFY